MKTPNIFYDTDPNSNTLGKWCVRVDGGFSSDGYDTVEEAAEFLLKTDSGVGRYVSFEAEDGSIQAVSEEEFRSSQSIKDLVTDTEWVWQYAVSKAHAISKHDAMMALYRESIAVPGGETDTFW